MSQPVTGFAGLGRMGGPMSARLTSARYQLIGYDPAGTQERLPAGAEAADSIAQLAAETDVILLSVPDGTVSVDISKQIAAAPTRQVQTVIDLSTIGIEAARESAAILNEVGIAHVDAPVSGGIAGATNGTLAMMIGAQQDVYESVEPILEKLAAKRFHVGLESGHGQAMKLLNNFVSGMTLAATAEATVFGAQIGLDLPTMVDVLNAATGGSKVSQDKFPKAIVPGTYDFGFAAALMTKDVSLYLENAEKAGVPTELASAAANVWKRFNEANPGVDFTYIHKYFDDQRTGE